MKVTAERIDNHKVVLEMEVPADEVAKAFNRAYQRLANKVQIPGFRKGKVPRKILEMRLGKEALKDEVFDILAPSVYSKALEEQEITPVTQPEIDVVTLAEGQPMVFKATVVEKPAVELGEYKDLSVKYEEEAITEESISKRLEELRTKQAKMVVKEDAVLEKGDFAIIDFAGFVDGQPFEGGDAQGYPLEVGSGSFIPGFEDQLIGAKNGEEREVKVTFPKEYFVEKLAGKEAQFKVKINDIKCKELPALDEEFVKEVSDFNTIEELKSDIKNKLEEAAKAKAEREYKANVIKIAVENAKVDIPEIMIEHRIDNMIEDLDINLQNRGMKLDQYLEYAKIDIDTLRKNYRETAAHNVKADLVLEAVAKAEKIEPTPEDMEEEIKTMAASYGASADEVRKVIVEQGRLGSLAGAIVRKKAYQIVIDNAKKE